MVRSAYSVLENIATSLLFTTTFISPRGGVFDVFWNFIRHSRFRNIVNTITSDGSWADPKDLVKGTGYQDYNRRAAFLDFTTSKSTWSFYSFSGRCSSLFES